MSLSFRSDYNNIFRYKCIQFITSFIVSTEQLRPLCTESAESGLHYPTKVRFVQVHSSEFVHFRLAWYLVILYKCSTKCVLLLNCSHLLFLWVRMFHPPSLTHHGSSNFKRKLFLLKYEARSSILKFWTNKYFLKPLSTGAWRNRWNAWCSCGRASTVLEQSFRLRLSQVGLKSCC